jgi:hypothetical protein
MAINRLMVRVHELQEFEAGYNPPLPVAFLSSTTTSRLTLMPRGRE